MTCTAALYSANTAASQKRTRSSEEARERSPFPIEQEPNPLPGKNESRLGDLTRFAEQWHTRLGRLDVNVNAAYLAIRNLHPKTLRFEQVRFTREAPVPPATSLARTGHARQPRLPLPNTS